MRKVSKEKKRRWVGRKRNWKGYKSMEGPNGEREKSTVVSYVLVKKGGKHFKKLERGDEEEGVEDKEQRGGLNRQ